MEKRINGSFYILSAAVLWSLSGILIKTVNAGVVWILLIRCFSAFIFTIPFIFKKPIRPVKYIIITGLLYTVFLLSFTITTRTGGAAMAVAMQYAAPLYLIAYTFVIHKKRDNPATFLLLAAGFFLCIADSFRQLNPVALIAGITTGVSFLMYSIYLKKMKTGSDLGIVSCLNAICAACLLIALPLDFDNSPASLQDIIILIAAGILISGISYTLYGIGLKKVSLKNAMIFVLAEPVLNPIWVYIFVKEIPPVTTIIGLILILVSIVTTQIHTGPPDPTQP